MSTTPQAAIPMPSPRVSMLLANGIGPLPTATAMFLTQLPAAPMVSSHRRPTTSIIQRAKNLAARVTSTISFIATARRSGSPKSVVRSNSVARRRRSSRTWCRPPSDPSREARFRPASGRRRQPRYGGSRGRRCSRPATAGSGPSQSLPHLSPATPKPVHILSRFGQGQIFGSKSPKASARRSRACWRASSAGRSTHCVALCTSQRVLPLHRPVARSANARARADLRGMRTQSSVAAGTRSCGKLRSWYCLALNQSFPGGLMRQQLGGKDHE
jgi:hypothetical protein